MSGSGSSYLSRLGDGYISDARGRREEKTGEEEDELQQDVKIEKDWESGEDGTSGAGNAAATGIRLISGDG